MVETSRMSVSVVVRAYNEGAHIGRLLEGLSKQTVVPDEILLVDSGSTDDTVEIARSLGCKVVTIAKTDFSFGRALNRGCEAASGDVLLIVSAHVYPVYDSYVEHMLGAFSRPDVAVAYGRQIGDERTKFSESRVMLRWFPSENIWDQGHPFSNNANAAVLQSWWARIRYESLTGLEDLDFAKKVISEGGKVAYVADAPVVHVHEETWSAVQNRYRREAIAYARIMPDAGFGLGRAIVLAASNIISDYRHAIATRKLRANFLGIPRFRFAQFIGAWQGFRQRSDPPEDLVRRFYYPPNSRAENPERIIGDRIKYEDYVRENYR